MGACMNIVRYSPDKKSEWNDFVAESRNGFFMFDRNYMDYHNDRFQDHSLMIYSDDQLLAVLPANEYEGTLYSHQGLTFGGFLVGSSLCAESMLNIFNATKDYLRQLNFTKVDYKAIPYIYHRYPS